MIAAAFAAASLACAPAVTGATAPERAAISRIVCLMPGSAVRTVQVVAPPARTKASARAVGIRILLDGYDGVSRLTTMRAEWEAAAAAGAIADGFRRLHLRPVVAYSARPVGTPPTRLEPSAEPVRGLLPRVFEVTAHGSVGPPKTLGVGIGTWVALDARLDSLDRRYAVHHHLDRLTPFGKAPAVTISAPALTRFLGGPGLVAYLRALRWTENRYDGIYVGVRSGGKLVWGATIEVRAGGGGGCGFDVDPGGGRIDAANTACTAAGYSFD